MTSEEFAKIEKLLIMDGYKKVVMYVHMLESERSKVIADLLSENDKAHRRIGALLKEISVLKTAKNQP